MYLLADKILNPDGTVKYGKKKLIKEWEQKWGVKFMENGFADLHRHGLDPHLCNPRDLLHQIPLGLYGEYKQVYCNANWTQTRPWPRKQMMSKLLLVSSLSGTPCCMLQFILKICNIPKNHLASMGKGVTGWMFGVCQQTEFLSYP
jgi:hypothetical protein